jgi:feruloyl esterase
MGALQKWREEGVAPDQITASYSDGPRVYKTRPVCEYPEVAIYNGEGDPSKAENFHCGKPTW